MSECLNAAVDGRQNDHRPKFSVFYGGVNNAARKLR